MNTNQNPVSSQSSIFLKDIFSAKVEKELKLPFFSSTVVAGFPSPADNHLETPLDLNELIVKHPTSTFYVKVEGESMKDAGITSGDILVVDRSLSPDHGKIVVAIIDGEFTVKRILIQENGVFLAPENPAFPRIKVNPESQFEVWGVVTYVIHKAK